MCSAASGRNAEAREGSERAIAIRERLVKDNPSGATACGWRKACSGPAWRRRPGRARWRCGRLEAPTRA